MSFDADKIAAAVRLLGNARSPGEPIATPPAELAPSDAAEAWVIHQAAVAVHGPVVGWKTGAPTPQAEPVRGEIAAATLFPSPARIPAKTFRLWAVEAEIAVTFGRDLAEGAPFEAEDILAAIDTWHAAIEILDTAFADFNSAPALWKLADRMNHGALVLGNGVRQAPPAALGELPVRLLIDGATVHAHQGGNTAGDPMRLLVALAGSLAATSRPIRAGDVVTTGSTTPFLQVGAGQRVRVEFDGLEPAELVVEA